jgi:hypothetical protein
MYPVAYYFHTKNKRITLNLFILSLGLYIFSAFYQDAMVFITSKRMTLEKFGSVFERWLGLPTLQIGKKVIPWVYPIAGTLGSIIMAYAVKECI